MENSENRHFITFKLCAILNSMVRSWVFPRSAGNSWCSHSRPQNTGQFLTSKLSVFFLPLLCVSVSSLNLVSFLFSFISSLDSYVYVWVSAWLVFSSVFMPKIVILGPYYFPPFLFTRTHSPFSVVTVCPFLFSFL